MRIPTVCYGPRHIACIERDNTTIRVQYASESESISMDKVHQGSSSSSSMTNDNPKDCFVSHREERKKSSSIGMQSFQEKTYHLPPEHSPPVQVCSVMNRLAQFLFVFGQQGSVYVTHLNERLSSENLDPVEVSEPLPFSLPVRKILHISVVYETKPHRSVTHRLLILDNRGTLFHAEIMATQRWNAFPDGHDGSSTTTKMQYRIISPIEVICSGGGGGYQSEIPSVKTMHWGNDMIYIMDENDLAWASDPTSSPIFEKQDYYWDRNTKRLFLMDKMIIYTDGNGSAHLFPKDKGLTIKLLTPPPLPPSHQQTTLTNASLLLTTENDSFTDDVPITDPILIQPGCIQDLKTGKLFHVTKVSRSGMIRAKQYHIDHSQELAPMYPSLDSNDHHHPHLPMIIQSDGNANYLLVFNQKLNALQMLIPSQELSTMTDASDTYSYRVSTLSFDVDPLLFCQ